ncbi:MAG: tetratricopeptide repeat protein [Proteobacteria bacterium]|nr:tetratricopeptide repeat protein [Pseudomonadota bacterium]
MRSALEVLCGELERLFSTDDLRNLCIHYLGVVPEQAQLYDDTKAIFARRLIEWCDKEKATEALTDAVISLKKDILDPRVKQVFMARFPVTELPAGTEVDDFVVEEKVKDGGLGSVYLCRAKDAELGEEEAKFGLKVIHAEHALDRYAAQRFKTLMRILKTNQDPSIQQIEAVGDLPDGRPFVVYPWVDGVPLSEFIPLSVFDALDMFEAVVDAIERVHERGFVHADLNPGNVLVCPVEQESDRENQCTLLGFGVDRLFHRAISETRGTGVYGLFNGLAPEQARGNQPDILSDIYGLGALLYEIVSGESVFAGDSAIDVVAAHITQTVPLLSDKAEEPAAGALDDLITGMLAKEPGQRPQSLDEIRRMLEDARRTAEEMSIRASQTGTRIDIEPLSSELVENPDNEELLEYLKDEAKNHNAWGAAIEVMEEAALASDDSTIMRHLLLSAAEAAVKYLRDYEKASSIYEQFLQMDPEDEEIKNAVLDLFRAEGRYEELIAELAARAEITEEPEVRINLIMEIADIYDTNLKDYSNAFDYYLACLTGTQEDQKLVKRLEKLAELTDRYEEFAAACAEAAQTAEAAEDGDTAAFFYERTGHCYLDQVGEPAYALTCFQKVLEFRPGDMSALQVMADLYSAAEQWNELAGVTMHLAESEQTPASSRDRWTEAAEILYERLGNAQGALELLNDVTAKDPAHSKATQLLTAIYEGAEMWSELAGLLNDNIEAISEEQEKLEARYHLGELYEDRIDDLQAAREQYENVLVIDPQHLDSVKGLERIFARTGDMTGLRDNLESQLEMTATPKQWIQLKERLAGIYEEEYKDFFTAIEYLQSILETEPGHLTSLISLTRLYRKSENWEALVELLARRSENAEPDEQKELLSERADLLREKIGDAQRAAEAYAEIASLGVDDALETLAKTQEEAGDYIAAVETLKEMAQIAADTEAAVGLLVQAAGIQLDKLDDTESAIETLRQVKDLDPENADVIAELRKVLIVQGNYAAAMDAIEEELGLVTAPRARSELYTELGIICLDHIGDTERAITHFEQALEFDANSFVSGDRVSQLYRNKGEWEKALPIYEKWANAANSLPVEKQIQLFTNLGEVYDQLDQKDQALKTFKRAADMAGDDPDLIRRLGEVALNLESFELAKEQLTKYLGFVGEDLAPEEKVEFLVKLGRACIGVEGFQDALKLLRQATIMSPEHGEARMLLADVHEQRGDFRGFVDSCEKVLAIMDEDDANRIGLLRRVAGVLFEKLKDAERASEMLNKALEIDPDDRTVLSDLLKIYTTMKRFSDVIEVVLRIADLIDDQEQLARYYFTVAKIYRRELKRPQKAVKYFEMALDNDLTLVEAEKAIIEILTERNEWERLENYYKKAIARLPNDALPEEKLVIYKPLSDLLVNKLDRRRDGVLICEAIAKLEPEEIGWQEKLVDLYGWDIEYAAKAEALNLRLLETNPARVDSFRMLYRIFSATEDPDKAWCAASLLSLINQASPEERTYYRDYQPEDLPTMSNRLQGEQWSRFLFHSEMNQTISSIFAMIIESIFQAKGQDFSRLGLNPEAAIDVMGDNSTFASFVNFAASALGINPPPLFYYHGQSGGFELVSTTPPIIMADMGLASVLKDRMGVTFALGQQLTLLWPGLMVHNLVESGTEMSAWLLASIKSFAPQLPVPADLAGAVSERLPSIRALSTDTLERLQGHVQAFLAQATDVNLKRWARSVDYTMDRAGLLLCGDVAIAVRMLKAQIKDKAILADRLRALTLFVISNEHFKLRDHLGIALRNA